MPDPPFQPLTLSVEEWQRIWTTQVESRDEGVNRIVKLRAECEAQAQAAASLRLQLRVITEQRDSLVVEQVSLRQRLEEANAAGENLHATYRELSSQLEQAQQEVVQVRATWAHDCELARLAGHDDAKHGVEPRARSWAEIKQRRAEADELRARASQAEAQHEANALIEAQKIAGIEKTRASQAEAALEDIQKWLNERIVEYNRLSDAPTATSDDATYHDGQSNGFAMVLAELQRRRSPTGSSGR